MFCNRFLFHVFMIQLQSHSVIQKHTPIFHIKTIKIFFIKNLIFDLHQQLILFNQKKTIVLLFFFILKTRQWRFNSTRKKNVYQNFHKMIQMFYFLKQDFKNVHNSFDEIIIISSFFLFVNVVNMTHKILDTPTKIKNFKTIKKFILSFKKLFVINKKMNESFQKNKYL